MIASAQKPHLQLICNSMGPRQAEDTQAICFEF